MDHRFWAEWDRSWLKLADTAVKIKNTEFMYDFTGIHAMNLQPVFADYSEFTNHQRSRRVHRRDARYPPNQQYDVRLFYVMKLVWAWLIRQHAWKRGKLC